MGHVSQERKNKIIQEVKEVGNISAVCRKHGLPTSTVHTWIQKANKLQLSPNSKRSQERPNNDKAKIKQLEQDLVV